MQPIVIREFGLPESDAGRGGSHAEPGSDEVLIRVHAVSVNRTLDLAVRAGTYAVTVALHRARGGKGAA